MLTGFSSLIEEAGRSRSAVGAFTCYDLEVTRAVLAVAAERDTGVILLISREAFAAEGGDQLLAGVLAAAQRSPARACVQLDHVADLELIESAFELGAGAAMADGSRLPFAENVVLVQAAQESAARHGAEVEAELGHVAGGEDIAAATEAGGLTDPDEAERFIAETGVACLAVSIGNVHGRYASEPRLDWDLLERLAEASRAPLSLHGASGLTDADLTRAVATGVRKINANTELREAYLGATRDGLDAAFDGLGVLRLHDAQSAAVRRLVDEKLTTFTGGTDG